MHNGADGKKKNSELLSHTADPINLTPTFPPRCHQTNNSLTPPRHKPDVRKVTSGTAAAGRRSRSAAR